MRVLLAKKYISDYNMRDLTNEVIELFDSYNFMCSSIEQKFLQDNREFRERTSVSPNKSSEELNKLVKIEEYINYVKEFERGLEYLKSIFTSDELKVFIYSIENRETDKEVCARICKTYKTYCYIKKSCYVKIALRFNLFPEVMENTLSRTLNANLN